MVRRPVYAEQGRPGRQPRCRLGRHIRRRPLPDGTLHLPALGRRRRWAVSSIGRPDVRIDTTAPPVATLARGTSSGATFSPNGDGAADAWTGTLNVNEGAFVDAAILGGDGTVGAPPLRLLRRRHCEGDLGRPLGWRRRRRRRPVRRHPSRPRRGRQRRERSGRDGHRLPRPLPSDRLDVALLPAGSATAYAPSTALGFTLWRPATVTWTVADAKGRTVATRFARRPARRRAGRHGRGPASTAPVPAWPPAPTRRSSPLRTGPSPSRPAAR